MKIGEQPEEQPIDLKQEPEEHRTALTKEQFEAILAENPDHIQRSLNLYGSEIKELPDGLNVHGNLELTHLDIAKLPENLHVQGSLDIKGVKINSLPDTLHVDGDILIDEALKEEADRLKEAGNIKGEIIIPGTKFIRPEPFQVKE